MNKPSAPPGDQDIWLGVHGDGKAARAWCFASLTLQGIRASPFQLSLTVLTMLVGAMTLSLTFFIGRGATERVWQDVEGMMGQWVVVHSDAGPDPRRMTAQSRPGFSEAELQELKRRLPDAKFVCPVYHGEHLVANRNREMLLPVDCVTEEVAREPLFRASRGSGFSASARSGMTWECLVTESAYRDFSLDLNQQPMLQVGGRPFRVVGVAPDPPRVDRRFQSCLIIPYESARILWIQEGTIGEIIVGWHRIEDMDGIVAQLRRNLDAIRAPNTYFLSSSQFSIQKSKDVVMNFMLVGAIQSFFCIVVASIGVLNVMLTNVTRRTHEYSVRLVMGASRREILASVVLESILISTLGAFLGVSLAVFAAPHLTSLLAARMPQAALLAPLYCHEGFLYPFLVCGLSGLAASVLPALRAGRLDVLASLRAAA